MITGNINHPHTKLYEYDLCHTLSTDNCFDGSTALLTCDNEAKREAGDVFLCSSATPRDNLSSADQLQWRGHFP